MKKKVDKIRDAIFIITQERSCPLYNVGEEIKVAHFGLSVSSYKACCLYLAREIMKNLTAKEGFGGFSTVGGKKKRFDCGGCEGLIHYEYKKDKDYATLQMKLLKEAEERRQRQHLDRFFGVLRSLAIFDALDDDALSDLTLLLDLKNFLMDKVVVKKGDPGSHLYIVLKGQVAVIADDGSRVAEMGQGEIFGEMSLLSGEPVSNSIHTITGTQLAMLSTKNFKHVIVQHPVLQIFLYKMFVERAQAMALRSGNISSGMTGELDEIAAVDLFQLINSTHKTGVVELVLDQGKAMVFFKEGQVLHARFLNYRNKDALFVLLAEKSGHFSYTKGIPKEVDNLPPIGDFMGLLMEGLQRIDEEQD